MAVVRQKRTGTVDTANGGDVGCSVTLEPAGAGDAECVGQRARGGQQGSGREAMKRCAVWRASVTPSIAGTHSQVSVSPAERVL